jgi:hypothetical protein
MILDPDFVTFDEGLAVNRSWSALSPSDQRAYLTLMSRFRHETRPSEKDRNGTLFRQDIHSIVEFINSSSDGRENRSIVCGLAISGTFLCVHIRQLKNFIARCKSSLNNSFQRLGFCQVDTKRMFVDCMAAILPSIACDPSSTRQWTVRHRPEHPGELVTGVFGPPFSGEAVEPSKHLPSGPSHSISAILVSERPKQQILTSSRRGEPPELSGVVTHSSRSHEARPWDKPSLQKDLEIVADS